MNDQNNIKVSFIIPALNEERHLPRLLHSIYEYVYSVEYEIIVVDNGSADATATIAQNAGARVLQNYSLTIGGLRNLGAYRAQGEVLVFLDADMCITRSWAEAIKAALERLRKNKYMITGSRAGISEEGNWIEKHWFLPMTEDKFPNYINSGHLIIRKDMFTEIGGFDENLRTGEDWDLCIRAKKMGVEISANPALHVIHNGYPRSLKDFVLREKWHGIQDLSSISAFRASLPAQVAILFWSAGLIGVVLSLYSGNVAYVLVAIAFDSMLCMMSTLTKRKRISINILYYFILFHAYYFARGLSLKDKIFSKYSHLHR